MSKYGYNYAPGDVDVTDLLMGGEQLIWSGKPKKSVYVVTQILTMLPIAVIWAAFDGFAISMLAENIEDMSLPLKIFLACFFALHLTPVWIFLSNLLTSSARWRHTVYAATDTRIIIASGLLGYTYDSLNYKDIDTVSLHVGLFDRLFGTGDVIFTSEGGNRSFLDIEDFDEAYALIQRAVTDIQADIEYPNALRPQENPGYNTRYTRNE